MACAAMAWPCSVQWPSLRKITGGPPRLRLGAEHRAQVQQVNATAPRDLGQPLVRGGRAETSLGLDPVADQLRPEIVVGLPLGWREHHQQRRPVRVGRRLDPRQQRLGDLPGLAPVVADLVQVDLALGVERRHHRALGPRHRLADPPQLQRREHHRVVAQEGRAARRLLRAAGPGTAARSRRPSPSSTKNGRRSAASLQRWATAMLLSAGRSRW